MRNIKKLPYIHIVLLLVVGSRQVKAAGYLPTDTANVYDELAKLRAVFYDTTHMSFSVTFYMDDVDTITVHDTANFQYKISSQKYRITTDSMEIIQNNM